MADRLRRYAFINAKLKTRLGMQLSDEFFNRLIHAPTLTEAVQLLHDTPFQPVETVYASTGDLKMGELELFTYEVDLHRELRKFLQDELLVFLDTLLLRFEIDNLKDTLRLWLDQAVRRRDVSSASGYLYRSTILAPIDWDELLNAPDIDALVRILQPSPYAELISANSAAIQSGASLFPLETDLDLFFYRQVRSAAEQLDKDDLSIVVHILGVEIDLENLSRIFRFRNFYNLPADQILSLIIPGGYRISRETIRKAISSASEGELLPRLISEAYPVYAGLTGKSDGDTSSRMMLIEELLLEILRQEVTRLLAGNPFTIGIMLSYFFLKHREVTRLSTILNAKYYGLDEDQIRRRL
jgi:V/A-type H+/Na+-transporting ATPase subunit C